MAGGEWSISLLPSACGRVTINAGNGLIDTVCGGALARGAPLTKRSGLRWQALSNAVCLTAVLALRQAPITWRKI